MAKIIAIVGMAGSGKGTITDYLESKGYPKIYFGGMVYDEVKKRGLDIVKDEKFVREDMRRLEGMDVMAKRASIKADELVKNGEQIIVFDGLYSWSEYKFLKQKYGDNMTTIAVFTPLKDRYERIVKRADEHRQYTLEDVKKRDYEEIENIEKGGPIAMADYTLVNDGSVENLIQKLEQIL